MPEVFNDSKLKAAILPKNSSLINYSILKEFYSPSPFRSFSIKYVVDGSELYSVNGKKYMVRNRQYLLANKFSEGFVEIDSKNSVKGICIDVAPSILSEVVASYARPDTAVSDLQLDTFFNTASFLENKYSAANTYVGALLLELETVLEKDPALDLSFTKEFYYALSERIIADHVPLYKELQSIKAVKYETRKDLLRKLYIAKEFMDTCFLSGLTPEAAALEAGISEYHFYRLFKSAFAISPYQYLLKKRLRYAYELLRQGESSISTVALVSGFSDIFNFSKAFKKSFGIPPSGVNKKT